MAWKDNYKRYDTSNGFGSERKWRESFKGRVGTDEVVEKVRTEKETPYTLLGIKPGATKDEIKKAYRKKMQEWHPDRNAHRITEATEMSKEINQAYQTLIHK